MKLIQIACLASTLTLTGCATGRIADLRDCGRLSVGAGPNFGIQARLGALTHVSLGMGAENRAHYGWESRYVYGRWLESDGFWPMALILAGFLQESATLKGCALDTTYVRWIEDDWLINPPPYRVGHLLNIWNRDNPQSSFIKHATDFECGVAPLLFSARVGINPLEIADFLLGFAGIDIAGDDAKDPMTSSTLLREKRRD